MVQRQRAGTPRPGASWTLGGPAAYGARMTDSTPAAPENDVMRIYDELSPDRLACLVCGSLVPRAGDYPRIHWDWHEASNGA